MVEATYFVVALMLLVGFGGVIFNMLLMTWGEVKKSKKPLMDPYRRKNLIEKLAQLEHSQWVDFAKSVSDYVPEEQRKRWEMYFGVYNFLPEDVKEHHRNYARKVLEEIERELY